MIRAAFLRLIILTLMTGCFHFGTETSLAQMQPGPLSSHFVLKADNTLTLYAVSEKGELQELFRFPANINIDVGIDQARGEWNLPSIENMVASPDGQHIAFTAYHVPTRDDPALFVYTVGDTTLQQHSMPGLGKIVWAPDSQSLLLTGSDTHFGNIPDVYITYLYTLSTGDFEPFSATRSPIFIGWDFVWLPDHQQFTFIGSARSCTPECSGTYAIYLRDRDSRQDRMLINLGDLSQQDEALADLLQRRPPTIYAPICYPVWSPVEQRLYYAAACIERRDSEEPFNGLYSVDLEGNNRLELYTTSLKPHLSYARIKAIIPNSTEGGVYITVQMETADPADDASALHATQLLYIDPASASEMLFEQVSAASAHYKQMKTALSQDQSEIALVGYSGDHGQTGYLIDINLSSHDVKVNNEYTGSICSVQWVGNHKLLYSTYARYCDSVQAPVSTWLLNTHTGESIDISDGLPGIFYIVSQSLITSQVAN